MSARAFNAASMEPVPLPLVPEDLANTHGAGSRLNRNGNDGGVMIEEDLDGTVRVYVSGTPTTLPNVTIIINELWEGRPKVSTTYQARVQAFPINPFFDPEHWFCGHKHETEEAAARCGAKKVRSYFIPAVNRDLKHDWRKFRGVHFHVIPNEQPQQQQQ